MKYKFLILTMVLLVLSLCSAYAGNDLRLGTAGAQELLIPVGSRGTAMGGAVLSTTYGIEAMYWNPAGLASLEGTEAAFTHLPYFADIDVNFFGIATAIEGFGTIGGGAKVVSIGDIEETTEIDPDGTGRIFSPSLTVLNLTYAREFTANVSFGINAMFIHEDIHEVRASGVAFDVGFIYRPRWYGLSLGLAVKNYGPEMQFSGEGFDLIFENIPVRPVAQKFDLPSSINIGVGYDFLDDGRNLANLSGNFRSNNYSADLWQGGAEYVYDGKYALRAGYNYSLNDPDPDDEVDENAWLYGFSFGGGVTIPLSGVSLTFEYSWNETGDVFDDNQFFTFRANF
ncbi:MAG: PorV/PorQ family protein [Candidatus Zixiibacteriota bacterium]|nr:MAG: PorV/PorQ family protein [candidate division Zixibacteria bacterium]